MEGMFHPKRLARAVAYPVDLRSAIWFRLIVSFMATLPLAGLFWMIVYFNGDLGLVSFWQPNRRFFLRMLFDQRWWEVPILWSAGATLWPVLPIGALITAYLWTGVLGYWVRGPAMGIEERKRAVAVSSYICGPLAFSAIPTAAGFGLAWGMWNLQGHFFESISDGCLVFGCVTTGVILAIYQSNAVLQISALTRDDGWMRKAVAIVGLPICWALAAMVGLVGFPMMIGLVWLMIDSLRG